MLPRSSQRSPPEKSVNFPPASVTSSDAGGDVPGDEVQLEEAVEDARGGVGEIERGRAGAAHAFRRR